MSTIIVGAGVTGLTVADRLAEDGRDVVVLEKEPVVGGLCRSYHYGSFTFDIGPHRLFSVNRDIHEYARTILNGSYSVIPRDSLVHMEGKYLDWPLSFLSALQLPVGHTFRCFLDLLRKNHQPEDQIKNLEDFVIARYGPTIYETFWRDYTEKFLGVPCREVDKSWGRISVGRSVVDRRTEPGVLSDLVKGLFRPKKSRLEFLYPDGGMGTFPERFADRIRRRGGRILLSQEIDGVETGADGIARIRAEGVWHETDELVWTGNLVDLCRLMEVPPPKAQYLSTLLFNLEVEGDPPGKWQWVYYPDSGCIFSRISRPTRFNPSTAPPGQTGLCVEVSCAEGSETWVNPESLKDRIYSDLQRVGLVASASQVRACHIERVPNTYPLYETGFRQRIEKVHADLGRYRNLHLVGRQASFLHDNIDEAIERAFGLTDVLTRKRTSSAAAPSKHVD